MKQLLGSNIMNLATCDHVLDFIKGHKFARYLQLTWYGGEPLIGAVVIKHFLSRLDELEEIKMVRHGLVTNATLLSGDHLELFREHPLSHIQVTLDGMENTHDKRRMRNDKSGTFRTILDNRLENNEHDAGYNLCSLYKNNQYENLKDVLYNFYKRYVECKQTVDDCCH